MLFSLYNHETKLFQYFDAPGTTPPHGWFRKPTPGDLKQPEEIAAKLPPDAVPVGSGPLPKGLIATNVPGVGTVDVDKPVGSKESGLGTYTGPSGQRGQRGLGVRPQTVMENPWDSTESRGRIK